MYPTERLVNLLELRDIDLPQNIDFVENIAEARRATAKAAGAALVASNGTKKFAIVENVRRHQHFCTAVFSVVELKDGAPRAPHQGDSFIERHVEDVAYLCLPLDAVEGT